MKQRDLFIYQQSLLEELELQEIILDSKIEAAEDVIEELEKELVEVHNIAAKLRKEFNQNKMFQSSLRELMEKNPGKGRFNEV